MSGPSTINWYRAGLRSPIPQGLLWPADHLYQSLLFFFPSPIPSWFLIAQGVFYWVPCRMDNRQYGKAGCLKWHVNCSRGVDRAGTLVKNTQGREHLWKQKYVFSIVWRKTRNVMFLHVISSLMSISWHNEAKTGTLGHGQGHSVWSRFGPAISTAYLHKHNKIQTEPSKTTFRCSSQPDRRTAHNLIYSNKNSFFNLNS